ncbi:filament-like plant protein 4 [Punica granatum]|uniref:Filament-like plant protein 4 n=2 Tax=Punica granatum TaxID=22663 RepID=A0A6P8E7V3_PUNGR|nr:filament-like plant protein 4 [Punica granatum]XP_031401213.1 filament-like plant protein 4 [Punica granatum]OWM80907.1 hypothetical protein CDL15_Pgr006938 [Punica granatum]PKI45680.1 hypothetical protein CRG98_033996 [Punica granatum]
MDKRSWPWKRKSSSDKAAAEKAAALLDSAAAASAPAKPQSDQENYKKPSYVQISVEQYSHLSGLEEQVRSNEEQIQTMEEHMKELDEQLTSAHAEITAKDNLAKQHAKVAEEAVSGWEKAEAEALALKNHLESVTLSKLTAEDRAAHLDGALKECMRQIRNLKEEHEQKLQDVVLTKTKQCEKIKHDLEAKIGNLDQELLRSAAENAALSRSLQERSNMLIQISEEKSRAEAEIEILKSNIESCEREINSLKYELHVVTKELDIRNEEKNMSVRSAEAANKQHMEGVKKIAKLEAECQRLRGLVRKRLPGPAALAQMKLEVESLGREYGDSRLKRSPVKPPSPHLSHVADSLDSVQKFHKENEFLTERLLAMEEETKMLKEALAKRNSELLASRNMCAQMTNRLQMLEAQPQLSSQDKSSPKSVVRIPADGSLSHNASNPLSLTSVSEDGNDDARSCAESWATSLVSDVSQIKKDKGPGRSNKVDSVHDLELMDDFLEMEKLACSTADSNGITSIGDGSESKAEEIISSKGRASLENQESLGVELSAVNHEDQLPLMKLRTKISSIFELMSKENEIRKLLDDITQAVQDASQDLQESSKSNVNGYAGPNCNTETCPADVDISAQKEVGLAQDVKLPSEVVQTISQDLASAISHIRDFVLFLGKEATAVHVISPHGDALRQQIEEFSATYDRVLCGSMGLLDFVHELSRVLTKVSELKFNILGYKGAESEINSPHCIDKVALPENKAAPQDSSMECYRSSSVNISDPTSNPEIPDCGNLVSSFGEAAVSCKVSMEDYEQLKSEKDNMALNLARSTENLEMMKSQLRETEQLLAEAKSQLASAQKSNSLSETQLKCMAESYRSLEVRTQELETEVNLLRTKTETLSNDLEEEKVNHQDTLTRCKDLEEQLTRLTSLPETEADLQTKQERELAAAAEKLAECQETIFVLGRQLKALHPQADLSRTSIGGGSQKGEDEPTSSSDKLQELDHGELDGADSSNPDLLSSLWSQSDAEPDILRSPPANAKNSKHRPSLSGSSSSSSTTTPEKQSRGFSRFFSSKGKNSH